MPTLTCIDDPAALLRPECLSVVSKDVEGKLTLPKPKLVKCSKPACETLITVQSLRVQIKTHKPCDPKESEFLDGSFFVQNLTTAYAQSGLGRGVHAGDFVWTAGNNKITGRMSGLTNEGSHRAPAFKDCQRCDEKGVMEGRLCGKAIDTGDPRLKGCQIIGVYRFKFTPTEKGATGGVMGVIEAVIMCPCRQ
jgi:hypothetical protein